MGGGERILYHTGRVIAVSLVLLGIGQVYIGIQFQRTTDAIEAEIYMWLGGVVAVLGFLFFLSWSYFVRPHLPDRDD